MRRAKFPQSSSRKPASVFAHRERSSLIAGLRRPESVLVVVYSSDAKVLLLERIKPFEFWQSVTGSLDPGESPLQAARRELQEETGLIREGILTDSGLARTFTIDPRWRDRYPAGVTENREYEWRYRVDASVDIAANPNEHSTWQWLGIDDAIESVWSWTNKEALRNLRAELE
jgi:dATP pyrophosphohydrolase